MTRLQIGFTGRYQGRGFWRQIFGSGPVRMTPIDLAIEQNREEEVAATVAILQRLLDEQEPSKHRMGSLFDLVDVRVFVQTKQE